MMVAPAIASLKLILRLTAAKCMTVGIDRQKAFGLKSDPRATMHPPSIIFRTGGDGSLEAHLRTRVRIMKRRVRTAAKPFLLSVKKVAALYI